MSLISRSDLRHFFSVCRIVRFERDSTFVVVPLLVKIVGQITGRHAGKRGASGRGGARHDPAYDGATERESTVAANVSTHSPSLSGLSP